MEPIPEAVSNHPQAESPTLCSAPKTSRSPELLMSSLEMAQKAARTAGVTDPLPLPAALKRRCRLEPLKVSSDPTAEIGCRTRAAQPPASSSPRDDKGQSPQIATNQKRQTGSSNPNPDKKPDAPAQDDVHSAADLVAQPSPSTNQLKLKSCPSPTNPQARPTTTFMADSIPSSQNHQSSAGNTETPNSSLGSSSATRKDSDQSPTSPASSETESMFAKREISQVSQTHQPMSALSSFSSRASLCRHARHSTEPPPHNHHLPHQNSARNSRRGSSNLDPSILGTSCNNCSCPSPPSSPPLQPNDRARIRTPASAVSSRRNSVVIGERIPFESMTTTAPPSRNSPAESVLPRVNHQRVGLNYAPARFQLPPEIDQAQHTHQNGQQGLSSNSGHNSPPHTPRSRCGSTTSLQLHREESRRAMRPVIDDLSMAAPDRAATPPIKHLRGRKAPLYIPAVLRPTEASSYTAANSPGLARRAGQSMQPPPRDHWVPDSARTSCAACLAPFTLLGRRHHCRKCGEIFCARDSRFVIALNQSLQFNLFGYPSRACANCSTAFTKHVLDSSRFASEQSQPTLPQGTQAIAANRSGRQENTEIIAGSLVNMPVDWNWSTF